MKKLLFIGLATLSSLAFGAVVKIQENFATTNTPTVLTNIVASMSGGSGDVTTAQFNAASNVLWQAKLDSTNAARLAIVLANYFDPLGRATEVTNVTRLATILATTFAPFGTTSGIQTNFGTGLSNSFNYVTLSNSIFRGATTMETLTATNIVSLSQTNGFAMFNASGSLVATNNGISLTNLIWPRTNFATLAYAQTTNILWDWSMAQYSTIALTTNTTVVLTNYTGYQGAVLKLYQAGSLTNLVTFTTNSTVKPAGGFGQLLTVPTNTGGGQIIYGELVNGTAVLSQKQITQ